MNTLSVLTISLAASFSLPLLAADAPAANAPASTTAAPAAAPAGPPAITAADIRAIGLPPTVAPDAVVTKLSGGFGFTEGVTTSPSGDPYFVDQNNNKILRWDVANGKLVTFLEPSNRSNGQYFDAQGNLIACTDERNELWSITPDGKHTVLISPAGYEGKPLDGPNDVWVRPDGGLYVTDPMYSRTWWDPSITRPAQAIRSVYYLSPDRKTLKRVAQDFVMPNGIVGTPDGKTLYVADIDGGKTYGFDIQPDGSLTNRRLVCNMGSDGMTLDANGYLYMSGTLPRGGARRGGGGGGAAPNGVDVIDTKTGKLMGFIPVPEQPANMAFAGKNHDTLYIAARTGFYSIPTKTKGANPAK